jgi:hypothetical protein
MARIKWPILPQTVDAPKGLFDGSDYALVRTGAETATMLAVQICATEFFSHFTSFTAAAATMVTCSTLAYNVFERTGRWRNWPTDGWFKYLKPLAAIEMGLLSSFALGTTANTLLDISLGTACNSPGIEKACPEFLLDKIVDARWWLNRIPEQPTRHDSSENRSNPLPAYHL